MKALLFLAALGMGALATVAIVFTLGYQATYAIMNVAPQENTKRVLATVKAVCDEARATISGESEQSCATAQLTSSTRYTCGAGPVVRCWVEEQ